MSPESLPSGYRRFIAGASRVADPCLPINRSTGRYGTFDPNVARQSITWKHGATPRNASLIEQYAQRAEGGDFGPPFAPCAVIHPWIDSCRWTAVDRFLSVALWIAPTYSALHILPPLVLRYKKWMEE